MISRSMSRRHRPHSAVLDGEVWDGTAFALSDRICATRCLGESNDGGREGQCLDERGGHGLREDASQARGWHGHADAVQRGCADEYFGERNPEHVQCARTVPHTLS